MRPKSLILLALALGCGLVAAMGINQVLANRRTAIAAAGPETERIFVAMQEISARHLVDAQMIKLEEWPKEKIPEGAIRDIDRVEGRFARTTIFPGEPILEMKLVNSDTGFSPTSLIPKGMRVVSVRVDDVAGGSSLLLPGDRVDIVVYVHGTTGVSDPIAKTVLQDIRVFAVNDVYKEELRGPDESSIKATTVSLLVTPEQAEYAMLASQMGQIRLSLRSRDDSDQESTTGALASSLLNGDPTATDRNNENLMQEKPPADANPLLSLLNANRDPAPTAVPVPVAQTGTTEVRRVTIIRGSEIEEIELVNGKPLRDGNASGMEPGPSNPDASSNQSNADQAAEAAAERGDTPAAPGAPTAPEAATEAPPAPEAATDAQPTLVGPAEPDA